MIFKYKTLQNLFFEMLTAFVTFEVLIMIHSPELTVTTAGALRVLHWLSVQYVCWSTERVLAIYLYKQSCCDVKCIDK